MVRKLAIAAAVAFPTVGATLAVGAFAIAEMRGHAPLSFGYPQNIAEAAGLGSAADVVRFAREGADATIVQPIRPEVISSSIRFATALEAAVWSGRVELVQLMDAYRLIPADQRHRLACLAIDLERDDITAYLADTDASSCDPNASEEVIRRTTEAGDRE